MQQARLPTVEIYAGEAFHTTRPAQHIASCMDRTAVLDLHEFSNTCMHCKRCILAICESLMRRRARASWRIAGWPGGGVRCGIGLSLLHIHSHGAAKHPLYFASSCWLLLHISLSQVLVPAGVPWGGVWLRAAVLRASVWWSCQWLSACGEQLSYRRSPSRRADCEERFFNQTIDHFSFVAPQGETFMQRYFVYDKHWLTPLQTGKNWWSHFLLYRQRG